jgi:hypothetical protein
LRFKEAYDLVDRCVVGNDPTGKCYVASEVLYYLCGGKESGFKPVQGSWKGYSHWWLEHKETGEIVDLTAGQFDFKWPYENGRGRGFQSVKKRETQDYLTVLGRADLI